MKGASGEGQSKMAEVTVQKMEKGGSNDAQVMQVRAEYPEAEKQELMYLPLSDIHVGEQVRRYFDEASIRELADSIREVGLQQPLTVRRDGDRWVLVTGERRLRALVLLGCRYAKCVSVEVEGSDRLAILQLVENLQREDMNPLEIGLSLKSLKDRRGYLSQELARVIGKSEAYVSAYLSACRLPEPLLPLYDEGKLNDIEAVRILLKTIDAFPERAAELVRMVLQAAQIHPVITRKMAQTFRQILEREAAEAEVERMPGRDYPVTMENARDLLKAPEWSNWKWLGLKVRLACIFRAPQVNNGDWTTGGQAIPSVYSGDPGKCLVEFERALYVVPWENIWIQGCVPAQSPAPTAARAAGAKPAVDDVPVVPIPATVIRPADPFDFGSEATHG